jgi:hypothetical protein
MNSILRTLATTGLFALAVTAVAEERLTVAIPGNGEALVTDLVGRVAAAVDDEDFKAYSQCFTKAARARHCKDAARLFVGHDLEMEIGRWAITDASPRSLAFTLQYTLYQDGTATEHVSEIEAVVSESSLQIAAEKPTSVRRATRTAASERQLPAMPAAPAVAGGCEGGHCPLVNMHLFPKPDTPLSLFNDASGKPNDNGPMWVDPFEIVKRFPEKSGRCGVLRAHGIDCETGKPLTTTAP